MHRSRHGSPVGQPARDLAALDPHRVSPITDTADVVVASGYNSEPTPVDPDDEDATHPRGTHRYPVTMRTDAQC